LEITLTKENDADIEGRRIEPEDFDWIVPQHQKQIYRILLCLVRDADVAGTLTQECFLRAFRKYGSFRGESGLSTWLVRIAINLAHDHNRNRRWEFWRRMARTERIDAIKALDASRSPEQALINSERLKVIQSAVEKLSGKQQSVFLLRYIEDLPLEEIAEAMNMKLGTVKSHLFRATEAVKTACDRRSK
jgi:RNA polymerase sigma-70 factor (ECF subfamily)